MDIKQIDWQKVVGRKADLQKAIQFSCNGAGGFGRFFEVEDLAHQLYYFDGRTTSIYFSEKEYVGFLKKVHDRLEDIQFVKKCEIEILDTCERCIKKAETLSKTINNQTSRERLYDVFKKFDDVWNDFYPIGWAFFFIAGFENIIEDKLVKSGLDREEAREMIKIAARPDRLTPVLEAEIETLKLAKTVKAGDKNIQEQAQELSNKFGWMSVYNTEDEIRSAEYYLEEAKKIIESGINIEDKLNSLEDVKTNNTLFISQLEKISDELLEEQLKFLHASGYLRDKREEARDRVTILEKILYTAVARVSTLSIDEVVYLTNEEIKNILNGKTQTNELQKTARKRLGRYVFTVDHGKLEIINDVHRIDSIVKWFSLSKDVSEIKGQVAYKQSEKVRGPAKIVFSNKELNKVKEGDVLIATMTKPDFLTTMKKAIAFVTDEGGITCHAAIVARELKKPCIIGTKIATQILKDGDLVEVDADSGIVKIIR